MSDKNIKISMEAIAMIMRIAKCDEETAREYLARIAAAVTKNEDDPV